MFGIFELLDLLIGKIAGDESNKLDSNLENYLLVVRSFWTSQIYETFWSRLFDIFRFFGTLPTFWTS